MLPGGHGPSCTTSPPEPGAPSPGFLSVRVGSASWEGGEAGMQGARQSWSCSVPSLLCTLGVSALAAARLLPAGLALSALS